jgi:hypothetical protein
MAIDTERTQPRSRRAILAGALGGVAGLVASRFASPDRTSAAAGGPVILGAANDAGTTNTSLTTSSTGTAMLVTQNGTGTALRGSAVGAGSIAGFFTANNGTGISGVTGASGSYGVFAQNNGAAGAAGALRASGGNNHGIVATTAGSPAANAVKAIHSGLSGIAVSGQSSATAGSYGIGVSGQADGEVGTGVVGVGTSATGTPNGVLGYASAPAANGVFGQMLAVSFGNGAAVRADGRQNHGVAADTVSDAAYAVNATHSGDNGTAVRGSVSSSGGLAKGVVGEIVGFGYAVYGLTGLDSGSARAVHGQANGASGVGVGAYAPSASGATYGVYGYVNSTAGTGVAGIASALSGVTYGVYGQTSSSTGYGVYSNGGALVNGDLLVTGAITAGTKDFRIDHPLDPANKFMSHSCVESDDRRTVYDGEVTLDAKGQATVTLPNWFETLNKTFRYQLTGIGPTDRILYIKSEIKDNAFVIGGGQTGQRVCWQITGIRQDPYAKANPLIVETAKAGTEKGRYLHPEVYGKPASKSIEALHLRPLPAPAPTKVPGASAH